MAENKQLLADDVQLETLENRGKADIVALYFARLHSKDELYKGICFPVLSEVAEKYGYKKSLLKNDKDSFDNYFDNGRKGRTDKVLEKRSKSLEKIYVTYKDMPLEEHQKLVDKILLEVREEGHPFYSIKTKKSASVEPILRKESNIEIDGLNVLRNDLTFGQLVFIVLGGDRGKPWVTWETGLIGIGSISELPYDVGYEGNNYKIRIDVKVLLDKPIERGDLKSYSDTYDIIGIGPITKWEPNQAISKIPEKKAVALMRAMLDLYPSCNNDLESVIDEKLMARVKGAVGRLIPQEVDYGEKVQVEQMQEEVEDCQMRGFDDSADVYEPDISAIIEGFSMSRKPLVSFKNFINSNKHIILTGPPGTGKTTLAERACEEAVNQKYISGYMITTAVSDWSTFDTVGGYMPDKDGKLVFQEGIFLRSICENKWLIVDEINRAEVDKALGHFFTVLSGKDVELQYKVETPSGEKHIAVCYANTKASYFDAKTATYYIGRNWRVIATMNTYDKNSLFVLSYAFMRRFAFVYIPAPCEDDFAKLVKSKLDGQDELAELLLNVVNASPKKLGAAIIIDLIAFIENAGTEGIIDGICSLIIPQYEGITLPQIKNLYKDIGSLFSDDEKDVFRDYLCEFFDISGSELARIKFVETDNDVNEYDIST